MGASSEGELLTFARNELVSEIEAAKQRVWLCSPFLTTPVGAQIAEAVASADCKDRRLLTALSEQSVRARVLHPLALAKLRSAGFEVRSAPGLHAKMSLVDEWALVGSGNLTGRGLGGEAGANLELGVLLSTAQRASAAAIFGKWWERATPVTDAEIAAYDALPRYPKNPAGPGDFGTPVEMSGPQQLEAILAEDPERARSRFYWINSNYHQWDDENWWQRGWISDWREAPYAVGDLIVIYLGAHDGGPASCPAVVRVRTRSHFARKWVLERRDPDAAERWPYVTDVEVVSDLPARRGVSLSLIGKTGQSVQGGYCSIDRGEFETLAAAMLDRA